MNKEYLNQIVLDPFMGSGTTAVAAKELKRNFIGFEANSEFHKKSLIRIKETNRKYPPRLQTALFSKPFKSIYLALCFFGFNHV